MSIEQFELMMQQNVSEIEDLPDFCTLPRGRLIVNGIKAELGTNQDQTEGAVKFQVGFVRVEEAPALKEGIDDLDENGEQILPSTGDLATFNFTGEKGLQRVKKVFGPVMEEAGMDTIRELLDRFGDYEYEILVSRQVSTELVDDNGDPRIFANIRQAVIAG